MLYLISYDLRSPNQDYAPLYDALRSMGPALNCLKSVWLLQSLRAIQDVRMVIMQHINNTDSLLIVDVTGKTYEGWLVPQYWDWYRAHNF